MDSIIHVWRDEDGRKTVKPSSEFRELFHPGVTDHVFSARIHSLLNIFPPPILRQPPPPTIPRIYTYFSAHKSNGRTAICRPTGRPRLYANAIRVPRINRVIKKRFVRPLVCAAQTPRNVIRVHFCTATRRDAARVLAFLRRPVAG